MKNILSITLIAFLAACSSPVEQSEKPTDVKEQISAYKKQIAEINQKIISLEEQIKSSEGETTTFQFVGTLALKPQAFQHYVEVNGSVEAVNEAFISPEMNGQVKAIFVKEGDHVIKGQVLLKINSSVVEGSLIELKTALELAKTIFEKQQQLWDKHIGSEIDFLQAKNNKEALEGKLNTLQAQIDMATIFSPVDGVVDEILVKEGELAIPGMQVIRVLNLSKLYVNADVSEAFLTKVKKGDEVLVEFPSYPEISLDVPVYRTGNMVKAANRTFKVQVKINNEQGMIKPNVLAKIKINDYTNKEALVVPSIVIKQDMKGSYVYISDENNNAQKTYIETGMSYNGMTEVIQGLTNGESVIVEGYNQVSDGSPVRTVH